jgi:glutamine phosphoribosylpyrophosphate amidotransferase
VRPTKQIPFLPIDPNFCRKKNVRRKLNAMALEFADKNVLIVDGMFVKEGRISLLTLF